MHKDFYSIKQLEIIQYMKLTLISLNTILLLHVSKILNLIPLST